MVSFLIARILLPPAMRALSRFASAELYQLSIIAFCLVCGWVTGYLVRCLVQEELKSWSSFRDGSLEEELSCPSMCSFEMFCDAQ